MVGSLLGVVERSGLSVLKREGRLGQEGNAHVLFVRGVDEEKEHLRGVMSSMSSMGVGGGGGGIEDDEVDEDSDGGGEVASSL